MLKYFDVYLNFHIVNQSLSFGGYYDANFSYSICQDDSD